MTLPIEPTVELSRLVYGTWRLADETIEQTPAKLLGRIKACLALGISTMDCADLYGGNHVCEKLLGAALALEPSLREKLQLVTKCGIVVPSDSILVKHYDTSKAYIVRRVNESLAALQTNHVDVLLLHRPSPMMNPDEIADAFVELKEKVRSFGVSNFTVSQTEMLLSRLKPLGIPLITNQIELHPLDMSVMMNGTLDYMIANGISPMIWSPLAQGRIMSVSKDPIILRVQSALVKVASQLGPDVTMDQVVYAWLLAHPSKPRVILGTNKIERIQRAVESLKLKLSLEQWFSIWEASAGHSVP